MYVKEEYIDNKLVKISDLDENYIIEIDGSTGKVKITNPPDLVPFAIHGYSNLEVIRDNFVRWMEKTYIIDPPPSREQLPSKLTNYRLTDLKNGIKNKGKSEPIDLSFVYFGLFDNYAYLLDQCESLADLKQKYFLIGRGPNFHLIEFTNLMDLWEVSYIQPVDSLDNPYFLDFSDLQIHHIDDSSAYSVLKQYEIEEV